MKSEKQSHEPYLLKIVIPGLYKMGNRSGRRGNHWNERQEIMALKCTVMALVGSSKPPKPLAKAELICVRFSSVEPDCDGLVIGFKHVIDALKNCGVIVDDKPSVIGFPRYEWRKAKPKKGFLYVQVKESAKEEK